MAIYLIPFSYRSQPQQKHEEKEKRKRPVVNSPGGNLSFLLFYFPLVLGGINATNPRPPPPPPLKTIFIFPPKTVEIEKQKTCDCLEYKVLYHPANALTLLLAQTDKNCTSGS